MNKLAGSLARLSLSANQIAGSLPRLSHSTNQMAVSLARLSISASLIRQQPVTKALLGSRLVAGGAPSINLQPVQYLHVSAPMESAMMKKKRKIDPSQLKAKEDRRRKKLVKALKKMQKKDRQPKPILELEVPAVLRTEAAIRSRAVEVPEEVKEERHYLRKDWARFALVRHRNAIYEQDRRLIAQQKALEELRMESEELYLAACQIDPGLIPFTAMGPTVTPPIKDYLQDGEYKDVTRQFKVVYEDTEAFMKKLLNRQRKRKKAVEAEDDD